LDYLLFQFKNITFVEKPFSKPLDLSKLIILNSEYYNPKIMSSTYEYAIKQAYFEKFHFKCRYPLQYFAKSCDTEGNPIDIFIKSSNFTETYQELKVFKDIKGKQTLVPFINEWVVDEKLRSYNQVAYIPVASKCPKDIYNLWSPFPILRVPLNESVDTSFIYDFINTLFSDNPVVVHYVLNWFAHLLQKPDEKTLVCLVLYGKQGSGKSTLSENLLRKIIGIDKMLITAKTDKIFGRFTNTRGKLLAVLNEASGAETFNITDILKDAITCTSTEQERKGIDSQTITDYTNYIFTTNNENSVKISEDDRRYLPIEVSNRLCKNVDYFIELTRLLDDEVVMRKFYQELMDRDIRAFNPSADRPHTKLTDSMMELKADSVTQFIQYWKEQSNDDMVDTDEDHEVTSLSLKMPANLLYQEFQKWWKAEGKKCDSCPTRTKFGVRLKRHEEQVSFVRTAKGGFYWLV